MAEDKKEQEEINEIIELSIKNGLIDFAMDIASLGSASKETVKKEIVPCVKKTIDEIKDQPRDSYIDSLQVQKIGSGLDLLAKYGIVMPAESIDQGVSLLFDRESFASALILSEKGASERMREEAIARAFRDERGRKLLFDRMKQKKSKEILESLKNLSA